MRIGAIYGRTVGGDFVELGNPGTPLEKLKATFKKLAASRGGLSVGGKEIDQVVLFTSSGFKRAKVRGRPEPKKVEGFASSLKALAEAVGLDEKELKAKRDANAATFPGKEEAGYGIAAVSAWLAGLE